jgi:ABC-type bacteriocin/lantibiotic exporter with double-glycine peptidase domain
MIKLKLFKQSRGYCGPASLKMVLSAFGIDKSEDYLAKLTKSSREKGCKEKNIIKIAKKFGFRGYVKQNSNLKELKALVNNKIPVIVAWTSPEEGGHYSVIVGFRKDNIFIADPHFGKVKKHRIKWFERRWEEKKPRTHREIMVIQKK